MNLKNLAMWGIIVFLTIGLYNMFKDPQSNIRSSNKVIFSDFLTEEQRSLNSSGVEEARWSGPCKFLSKVKCFSITLAPREIDKMAASIPAEWSEYPTGKSNACFNVSKTRRFILWISQG